MYQEQANSVGNSRFILPHIELSSRRKANINAADRIGETPLHYAAKRNRLEQVKLLFKKGAVIYIINRFVYTPLYNAVRSGHTSMVKLLLGKGADINIASNSCVTVLHLSVLKFLQIVSERSLHIFTKVGLASLLDLSFTCPPLPSVTFTLI